MVCRFFSLLLLVGGGLALLRGNGLATAITHNHALTLINQAIATLEPDRLARGQLLLNRKPEAVPEHHHNLFGAKFDLDNLIVNGDFEFYTHAWQMGGPSSISRELPFAGHQVAAVTFANQDISFYHLYQRVRITPGETYRLTAWIRIAGEVDGIALDVWDGPRGYQHWYGGRTASLAGPIPWTQTELIFTTPADVNEIQVRLRRLGDMGRLANGTVYIDEVRLEPARSTEAGS
jgi:hypothetical protein